MISLQANTTLCNNIIVIIALRDYSKTILTKHGPRVCYLSKTKYYISHNNVILSPYSGGARVLTRKYGRTDGRTDDANPLIGYRRNFNQPVQLSCSTTGITRGALYTVHVVFRRAPGLNKSVIIVIGHQTVAIL